ncbi:uncharacterized protein F5147DRAFT_656280 [Suillus discolor]|uniref:Uncharacterized protein n=1 Tax=Suillus discolor TaxID=1912936 RepID=A0A9P7JQ33_9AGAM|nr:uncharacterized protein F5147DRAFT_656280 [Suillus discolor]KAG2097741.1 hypothetical protein F5147DRAFT_656280 [Suillus discolor]
MHAWSWVAYMPIPQFVCHPDFFSLLQAHVWHWCMDIVFVNLKSAAVTDTQMVDPVGNLHYAFTSLVAYTADLPEQQLIACSQFGDEKLYLPRFGHLTIKALHQLCQCVDPCKVQHFQEKAKAQSPTFTPTSIATMKALLEEFHHFKGSIILAKACRGALGPIDHFQILKLELLASFS